MTFVERASKINRKRSHEKKVSGAITIHAGLSDLRILHGQFVFDICSGKFHRVSETAAFILSELKERTPLANIVTRYAARYGISCTVAERDIELVLNDLSVVGMPMSGAGVCSVALSDRESA
jgi:hypothetical protein